LIECHTHLLARVTDVAGGYAFNLATKSEADRALAGAAMIRVTLEPVSPPFGMSATKVRDTRRSRCARPSTAA
jgi:hypothetical protein